MLRHKYSYRNNVETGNKLKSKAKVEIKFAILQKQAKGRFAAGNAGM